MLRSIASWSGLLLFCALAHGQVISPVAAANDAATLFGNGEGPQLKYAREQGPLNLTQGELSYEGAYDDNPLSTAGSSEASAEDIFAANLIFQHQGSHVQATAGYQPYYEHFSAYSQYDQFNQAASADIRLIRNATWSARVRDSYSRQRGRFEPLVSESLPPAPGAPGGLNRTIYTPLDRVEANSGRVDLVYQRSLRSFVDLFGGYDRRNLSQFAVATTLYNTRGAHGGAEFAWRPSERSIIGILGLFQRLEFPGVTEIPARIEITSFLPTWGVALRPGWQLQAYAGPQIWAEPKAAGLSAQQDLAWAGGGTLSHRGERTALFLSAGRILADGGGLLSIVESTTAEAGLRHRLPWRWDGGLQAGFARNSVLARSYGLGSYREVSVTTDLVRPLRGNLVWHVEYEFFRQFVSGGAPTVAEFHRNRIVSGLSWQFAAIPLVR